MFMAYEVQPAVAESIACLEEMANADEDDIVDSFLRKFHVNDEDGLATSEAEYPRAGHERQKPCNQEFINIELGEMSHITDGAIMNAMEVRKEGADVTIPLTRERFATFDNNIFKSMTWLDPQFWSDERDFGKNSSKPNHRI